MIVRDTGTDLVLIRQPDHAALAARVMQAWRDRDIATRPTRDAALLATRLHDGGWAIEDDEPQWDPATRRPFDFIAHPMARRQALWPRGAALAGAESTYAAALVAQHALTAYRHYEHDAGWQSFFRTMEDLREQWFQTPPRGPAHLDPPLDQRLAFLQDYAIVRLGDLVSLAFCTGWPTPHECEGYHIAGEGNVVRVTPDPFAGEPVPLRVDARRLPARAFDSADGLRAAWHDAPVIVLEGTAIGVVA